LVGHWLPLLELLTVLAVTALVGLNFRSLIAPLLTLAAAGVAFVLTARTAGLVGELVGVAAPAELEPLLVALLLGVVTDYTIFYLSALQHAVTVAVPANVHTFRCRAGHRHEGIGPGNTVEQGQQHPRMPPAG
jgi:uncharacterized membrane protein YdfJ with MMPL/SSD domain